MKCSNCANEMITSRTGWLCVSCGHAELARPTQDAGVPQIVHERPRGRLEEPKAGETAAAAAPTATPAAATPAVAPAAPAASPASTVAAAPVPAAPAPAPAPAEVPAAAVPVAATAPLVPAPAEVAPPAPPAPEPIPAVPAPPASAAEVPIVPMPSTAPPAAEPDVSVPAPVMDEILAAVNAQQQNGGTSVVEAVSTPAPSAEPEVQTNPVAEPAAPVEKEDSPATETAPVSTQPEPEPEPTVTSPSAELEDTKDTSAKLMTDLVPHTALSSSPAVLAAVQAAPAPPSRPEPRGGRKAFLGLKKKSKHTDEAPAEIQDTEKTSEVKPEETKLEDIPATPAIADVPQASSNELTIGADGQAVYGEAPAAVTAPVPAPAVETAESPAKAETDAEPANPTETQTTSTPEPETPLPAAPETAPLPEAPVVAAAPKVPGKTPLQPHTHPKPLSAKQRIAVWSVLALVVLGAGGAAYYLGLGHKVVGFINSPEQASAGTPSEPSPQNVIATPSPKPAPATPAPTPVVDNAALNAQRQQDMNVFAEAFRKTARNGFYTVALPTSYPKLNDPQTAAPYALTTALPSAPGQIRYWIGGSCTGAARTPGAVASRYLALQVYQTGQSAPACVQVNQP